MVAAVRLGEHYGASRRRHFSLVKVLLWAQANRDASWTFTPITVSQ